jgi:hypothetical protein
MYEHLLTKWRMTIVSRYVCIWLFGLLNNQTFIFDLMLHLIDRICVPTCSSVMPDLPSARIAASAWSTTKHNGIRWNCPHSRIVFWELPNKPES